jgi:hypothetical protein
MPTVIDSLVVLLKLDPSQFTEGQKKAAADLGKFSDQLGSSMDKVGKKQKQSADDETRQQKDRLKYNKDVAESYAKVTDQVLRFGATVLATGSMTEFIKSTIQMDAGLGRFAERLGLNKDQLGIWTSMVSQMGISAKEAGQQVMQAADTLNQIREAYLTTGDVSKVGFLQQLGVSSPEALEDPLKALETIHRSLIAKHMTTGEAGARTGTFLLQQLGMGPEMISLLESPTATFAQIQARAVKDAPATRKQMDESEKATAALGRLDDILHRIAGDAAGPVATALSSIADIAEKFPGATKAVVELVAAVIALRTAASVGALLMGGGRAAAAVAGGGGAAAGGGGVAAVAGGAAIAAAGALMTGPIGQKGDPSAYVRASNDPDHASDDDLKAAIAFAQNNLANAPPQYKGAAAAHLEKLAQAGLARWGPARGVAPAGGGATDAGGYGSPYQNPSAFFSKLLGGRKVRITEGRATSGHVAGSEHYTGDAWDFTVPGMTNDQAIAMIRASGVPFDELFDERNHIHMGFRGKRGKLGRGFGTNVSVYGHQQFGAGAQSVAGAGDGQSTTNIGTIIVNTKATDAKGIAKELPGAIAQAGRGLT